jgi:hypothetical protein
MSLLAHISTLVYEYFTPFFDIHFIIDSEPSPRGCPCRFNAPKPTGFLGQRFCFFGGIYQHCGVCNMIECNVAGQPQKGVMDPLPLRAGIDFQPRHTHHALVAELTSIAQQFP